MKVTFMLKKYQAWERSNISSSKPMKILPFMDNGTCELDSEQLTKKP